MLLGATLSVVMVVSGVRAAPAPTAHASDNPRCFGAASRDPVSTCDNPGLALTVTPAPAIAQITPNAPCRLTNATINLCTFGVARSATQIALVGDSHAEHWRAALNVAARTLKLKALSITRSSCPFTAATTVLPEPLRSRCRTWVDDVERWFTHHPHVHTVFLAAHRARVATAPGQNVQEAQIRGFVRAWRRLPPSVKHLVVIRDTPYARTDTLACVEQAIENNTPAGPACALPRDFAVHPDPEALAASRVHRRRPWVIDLTDVFCDEAYCYPVIGGALVYKDGDHLTRTFSTTVGPLLSRMLAPRLARWSASARGATDPSPR